MCGTLLGVSPLTQRSGLLLSVSPSETLYSPCGVDYPLFAGKVGMATAAYLYPELLLCRPRRESIAADANHLSVGVVSRMNLVLHFLRWEVNADFPFIFLGRLKLDHAID